METHRKVGDWLTVRESRRWKTHRKAAGWLNAVLGLFGLGGLGLVLGSRSDDSIPLITVITALGFLALHLVGGIGFVFGQRWSRLVLWPISVVYLFAFPFGTALGGYNIWVLYNTRGQTKTDAQKSGGVSRRGDR